MSMPWVDAKSRRYRLAFSARSNKALDRSKPSVSSRSSGAPALAGAELPTVAAGGAVAETAGVDQRDTDTPSAPDCRRPAARYNRLRRSRRRSRSNRTVPDIPGARGTVASYQEIPGEIGLCQGMATPFRSDVQQQEFAFPGADHLHEGFELAALHAGIDADEFGAEDFGEAPAPTPAAKRLRAGRAAGRSSLRWPCRPTVPSARSAFDDAEIDRSRARRRAPDRDWHPNSAAGFRRAVQPARKPARGRPWCGCRSPRHC